MTDYYNEETHLEEVKEMKKVVKFGGSSLANADQFKKVGAIIGEDESRRYVVPSAPGKRFSSDIKAARADQRALSGDHRRAESFLFTG